MKDTETGIKRKKARGLITVFVVYLKIRFFTKVFCYQIIRNKLKVIVRLKNRLVVITRKKCAVLEMHWYRKTRSRLRNQDNYKKNCRMEHILQRNIIFHFIILYEYSMIHLLHKYCTPTNLFKLVKQFLLLGTESNLSLYYPFHYTFWSTTGASTFACLFQHVVISIPGTEQFIFNVWDWGHTIPSTDDV